MTISNFIPNGALSIELVKGIGTMKRQEGRLITQKTYRPPIIESKERSRYRGQNDHEKSKRKS